VAAKVFERFYRGDPSRARSSGGSGLGLSIAKSIVETHGGRIAVHTAPGEGCRFTIAVPASG
jgi:two-component system OmpR family sensor kinase